ncbi:MAG: helix-turn-helix domain-containing protein [bacterium]
MDQEKRSSERRRRRIARRRAQILDAAARVIRQKGYHRATMQEIARAADVSAGTLYNYFQNKRDLFAGLLKDFAERTAAEIQRTGHQTDRELLSELMERQFAHMLGERTFISILHEARMDPELREIYAEELIARIRDAAEDRMKELIEAGTMHGSDTPIAVRTLVAVILGYIILMEVGGDPELKQVEPRELGERVAELMLRGLRAAPEASEPAAS